jgi:hypothetical protein
LCILKNSLSACIFAQGKTSLSVWTIAYFYAYMCSYLTNMWVQHQLAFWYTGGVLEFYFIFWIKWNALKRKQSTSHRTKQAQTCRGFGIWVPTLSDCWISKSHAHWLKRWQLKKQRFSENTAVTEDSKVYASNWPTLFLIYCIRVVYIAQPLKFLILLNP